MPPATAHEPAWANLVPLIAVALVILRNMRARRLRIEAMWVAPGVIVLLIGRALYRQEPPTPISLAMAVFGLVVGAAVGWWRARFTHISVDPVTHELTS